jgi:HEAT repeat protein
MVLLLGMVIGCGEASRPNTASLETAPDAASVASTDANTTAAAEAIELESVPAQGVPSATTVARAKAAFANLITAAEAGEAAAWTKAEAELNELGLAAIPTLTERLSETNPVARELAAMFLAQLGPDAASAADGLLQLLDDDSTFARVNAAAALSTFEGHAERVIPVLTELLADADVNVRITAATSLRNVSPVGRETVATLSRLLTDNDSRVRAAAATTLGEWGKGATSSLAALRRLGDDEDEQVRSAVSRAIKRIDETARTAPVTIPASATE